MYLPFEHMARTDTRNTNEATLDAQFGKGDAQIALLKAKKDEKIDLQSARYRGSTGGRP
jgi:hypothetical protein